MKDDCTLNDLGYCHVTNNLVFDLWSIHDLFGGLCATEILLNLNHLIFQSKYFTLSILNDSVINFSYG